MPSTLMLLITNEAYKIAIDLLLHEIGFAVLPIVQQVLGQKGRDNHAHTIMHPSSLIQLTHLK